MTLATSPSWDEADAYLERAFPGATLRLPLIGQWSPSARFELGGEGGWAEDDPDRIARVHDRGIALFGAAFEVGDDGFVIAQYETPAAFQLSAADTVAAMASGQVPIGSGTPIRGPLLATMAELEPYLPAARPAAPDPRIGSNRYGEDLPYADFLVPVSPTALDWHGLLRATLNREMPSEPSIGGTLFFVDMTRNIIVQAPDDRFLDIAAADAEVLRPIVGQFVDWLISCYLGR